MKQIIDEFYESRVKQNEEQLNYEFKTGKLKKYLHFIIPYIIIIFISGYVIFNLYNSPIGSFIIPFFIIIDGIVTGILIYCLRKIYLKTSSKISIKERILNRLNLEENRGIDKLNLVAAGIMYFVSIFIASILYFYSFIILDQSFMTIVSTVIMSLIIFLIYRAFLVRKTKLTKEFFIIKKPIFFQKTYIKWSNINSVETAVKYRGYDRESKPYTVHNLILITSLNEKPFKIYLGKNRNRTALKILKTFFEYMIKLDQD